MTDTSQHTPHSILARAAIVAGFVALMLLALGGCATSTEAVVNITSRANAAATNGRMQARQDLENATIAEEEKAAWRIDDVELDFNEKFDKAFNAGNLAAAKSLMRQRDSALANIRRESAEDIATYTTAKYVHDQSYKALLQAVADALHMSQAFDAQMKAFVAEDLPVMVKDAQERIAAGQPQAAPTGSHSTTTTEVQ